MKDSRLRPLVCFHIFLSVIQHSEVMVFQSFKGVVDCDVDFDTSGIAGKTVIVTGGVCYDSRSTDRRTELCRCQRHRSSIRSGIRCGRVSLNDINDQ